MREVSDVTTCGLSHFRPTPRFRFEVLWPYGVFNVLLGLANVGLKRFYQEGAMQRYVLALLIVAAPFSAFAAELPKEGSYDFTSCASGVASVIDFSKTHTGSNFEETGTIRSNPPEACLIRTLIAA
jgi:hypothetical protein